MKPEGTRSGIAQLSVLNRFNKWFHLVLAAVACGIPSLLFAQQITVDITPDMPPTPSVLSDPWEPALTATRWTR